MKNSLWWFPRFLATGLALLKPEPYAILVCSIVFFVYWFIRILTWPDSVIRYPLPRKHIYSHILYVSYISYFLINFILLTYTFGLIFFALDILGHNVLNRDEPLILSMSSADVESELYSGKMPKVLQQKLGSLQTLTSNAIILNKVPGAEWIIEDGKQRYIARKDSSSINIYKEPTKSLPISIYFSIVTATTLGYGDLSPRSSIAKFFAILEVSFGVIFITTILTVALAFRSPQNEEEY